MSAGLTSLEARTSVSLAEVVGRADLGRRVAMAVEQGAVAEGGIERHRDGVPRVAGALGPAFDRGHQDHDGHRLRRSRSPPGRSPGRPGPDRWRRPAR